MPDQERAVTEDEIRPIRQAADGTARNYNTTTTSENHERTNVTKPADAAVDLRPTGLTASSSATAARGNAETTPDKTRSSWVKDIAERYGSITLENKGSVARDHLALERTFLAWLRTSLAFASIGIAITQLFRLNTSLPRQTSMVSTTDSVSATTLPFSPFVGHAISPEMAPYLQGVVATKDPSVTPTLGPTLFDQLFSLSADGKHVSNHRANHVATQAQEYQVVADSKIKHLGKPLGATFIGISIVILLIGFHRYFESQYWIIKGKFPASRGSVGLVGLLTGALIVTCLVVIVVVDPTAYERKKR